MELTAGDLTGNTLTHRDRYLVAVAVAVAVAISRAAVTARKA
ncbi:hypothetical protein ACH4NT_23340 [Streptomyces lydicus]